MAMLALNPAGVPAPSSAFSQTLLLTGPQRRLVISGQTGLRTDGTVPEAYEDQVAVALSNLVLCLRAHGFSPGDLIRLRAFATVADGVSAYRRIRQDILGDHRPAATFAQVLGLAHPEVLFEIEAEAAMAAA